MTAEMVAALVVLGGGHLAVTLAARWPLLVERFGAESLESERFAPRPTARTSDQVAAVDELTQARNRRLLCLAMDGRDVPHAVAL